MITSNGIRDKLCGYSLAADQTPKSEDITTDKGCSQTNDEYEFADDSIAEAIVAKITAEAEAADKANDMEYRQRKQVAGEKMFLALSFIAAIRDITGYKFPLIIDTPLGRISGTPRINVAQKMSEFLPNSQLVLLTTDTEYISPIVDIDSPYSGGKSFREYLRATIQTKEYRLKMDQNSNTTEIIPYAPKNVVLEEVI